MRQNNNQMKTQILWNWERSYQWYRSHLIRKFPSNAVQFYAYPNNKEPTGLTQKIFRHFLNEFYSQGSAARNGINVNLLEPCQGYKMGADVLRHSNQKGNLLVWFNVWDMRCRAEVYFVLTVTHTGCGINVANKGFAQFNMILQIHDKSKSLTA